MALSIGELTLDFVLDTASLDDALDGLGDSINSMGDSLMHNSGFDQISGAAKKFGMDVIGTTKDFNATLSRTFAIMGAKAQGLEDDFRQAALDIGERSSFTASQVAQVQQVLAMAGWDGENIMNATNAIVRMAEVAGTQDIGAVSSIMTTTLGAFGKSADDAERLANILTLTATSTNSTVLSLGTGLSYAAQTAGTLGFTMEDTAFTLGLFANLGMKGSRAGTTMVQMFNGMTKGGKKAEAAMKMVTDTLGRQFSLYDEHGNARNAIEIYKDMRTAAKQWTQEQKMRFATDIGGVRGKNGILAILNTSDQAFNNLYSLYGDVDNLNGLAERKAEDMMNNLAGAIMYFQSAMDTFKINLGTAVDSDLQGIIKRITGIVNEANKLEAFQFNGMIRMVGYFAALGPAATALGIALKALPKVIPAIVGMTGPMGMIGLGIAAIGMAVLNTRNDIGRTLESGAKLIENVSKRAHNALIKAFPRVSERLRMLLTSVVKSIGTAVPGMAMALTDAVTFAADMIAAHADSIASVGRTLLTSIAAGFKKNAPRLMPSLAQMAGELIASSIKSLPSILQAGADIFDGLVAGIKKVNFKSVGVSIHRALTESISEIKGNKSWGEIGGELWGRIEGGLTAAFTGVKDLLGGLLLGKKYNKDDDFKTFGTKIVDAIFQGIDSTASGATEFVNGFLDGIGNLFSDANIASATEALTGVVERIITKAGELIPTLTGKAGEILTKIGELLFGKDAESKGLAGSTLTGATNLANSLVKAITAAIPKAGEAIGKLLSQVATMFTENAGDFGTGLGDLATAIITGIGDTIDAIVTAMDTIGESVDMDEAGQSYADMFTNFYTKVFGAIAKLFSAERVGKMVDTVATLLSNVLSGITTAITSILGDEDLAATLFAALNNILAAIGTVLSSGGLLGSIVDGALSLATGIVNVISTGFTSNDTALVTGLKTMLQNLGTIIQNIFSNADTIIVGAGELATGLINAIANGFSEGGGLTELTGSIGDLIADIIGSIATTLSTLMNTIATTLNESDLDGAASGLFTNIKSLAGKIVQAIADAIPMVGEAAGNLGQALLDKLVDVVSNLPSYIEGVLSFGAQIANTVMENISTAFKNMKDSGISDTVADAAIDLVHGLLTSVTEFGENEDVKTFMENLGTGLSDAMEMIGDVAGQIIGYIFSPEGLTDIYNAGKTIANLLWEGIRAAFKGLSGLIVGLITGIINQTSDPHGDAAQYSEMILGLQRVTKALFDSNSIDIETPEGMRAALLEAVFGTFEDLPEEIQSVLNTKFGEGTEGFNFVDLVEGFIDDSYNWSRANGGISADKAREFFNKYFGEYASLFGDLGDDFFEMFASTFKPGDQPKEKENLYNFQQHLLEMIFGENFMDNLNVDTETTEEEVRAAAERAGGAAAEAARGAAEAAEEATQSATEIIDKNTNEITQSGYATAVEQEGQKATNAALNIGNEVVQQTLLTMSAENGTQIGTQFVSAIESAIVNSAIATAALNAATDAKNNAANTLSMFAGFSIGISFASGVAAGIFAGIPGIIAAAVAAALAGKTAFDSTLKVGSPSRVMKESGWWFDEGVVVGIMSDIGRLVTAAENAGAAVEKGFNDRLGIHSPSTVMERSGKNVILGANKSMSNGLAQLANTARKGGEVVEENFFAPLWERGKDPWFVDTDGIKRYGGTLIDLGQEAAEAAAEALQSTGGEVAEEAAEELTEKKPIRKKPTGNTQTNNRTYEDNSSFNVQTVKVQGMDDIQALASEVAGIRRRRAFGYGTR